MDVNVDERLMHDHAELGDLLDTIGSALEAGNASLTHPALDLFWARLAMHIRAEHLHLFPAISRAASRARSDGTELELPPDEPEKSIATLHEDHDFFMRELSQAVAITRRLLANEGNSAEELPEVEKKVLAIRTRLIEHNAIEETGIYIWCLNLLSEAEQSELGAQVQKELENMPPRFGVV
ncbi:MAG TPA: hypothetical protein VFY34_05290 [Pyrinomonadaceae bacterium]|nr:hypothetical protein [Pyrinomonadaceae bacterium]